MVLRFVNILHETDLLSKLVICSPSGHLAKRQPYVMVQDYISRLS